MGRKIVPDIVDDQHLCVGAPETTVHEAAKMMADRRIGAVMVVTDGRLEGIFTERDLTTRVVAQGRDPKRTALAKVMTKNPQTLSPDDTPASALAYMRERGFRHVPVIQDGRLVGIVSMRDLYAEVNKELEDDVRNRDAFIFGVGYGGLT